MKKRILTLLMALVLILSLVPTVANAASDEAKNAANALYQLGLFSGTGTDALGNPNFDLDRTPVRNESVAMLVRLLGRASEAETNSNTYKTPFTDVVAWAKPYVGYAYVNNLTSGTSDTTFGGAVLTSPSQYIAFVLRALGYEIGVDFQWNKAWELSDQLGFTEGQYNENTKNFTRGDVAIISHNALSCKLKDKDTTLIDELIARGAVKEHTHNYVTQSIEYSKEVLIGTETVNDYAQVTIYGCNRCSFTTYDANEMLKHNDARYAKGPCVGANYWSKTTTEVVGTHEEPKYATRWVSELVRVCSICGHMEP